jgi:hypothetical protein
MCPLLCVNTFLQYRTVQLTSVHFASSYSTHFFYPKFVTNKCQSSEETALKLFLPLWPVTAVNPPLVPPNLGGSVGCANKFSLSSWGKLVSAACFMRIARASHPIPFYPRSRPNYLHPEKNTDQKDYSVGSKP